MIQVTTTAGTISGGEGEEVLRFLGIPFAEPPTGDRRWKRAQPISAWEGVRDATEFAPGPIQTAKTAHTPRGGQSEDCLYLNVWTPSVAPAEPYPVMFWIHGGGFLNGAASMPIYDGEDLARSNVVVVSVEYRLGAFGFAADEGAGTNFGLTDWVVALEWVRDNVAAFGGDPDCVTVFGQSAGAAATRTLLSAPDARGLFHRAIIQSAGLEDYAVVASPSLGRSQTATANMLSALGVGSIDELRDLDTESVRAASLEHSGIFPPPHQVHTPANLVWYPVLDDDTIRAGFDGWADDVPVMLGCTEHEARTFIAPDALYAHPEVRPEDAYTGETLATMAQVLAGASAPEVLDEVSRRGLTAYEALAELYTSALWHEPELATLKRFAAMGRTVFHYRFARVSPGAERLGTLAGHAAENPYVFGILEPAEDYDETDRQVSGLMQAAWTAFARTGVPQVDTTPWPAFDASAPCAAVITDQVTVEPMVSSVMTELIHAQRTSRRGTP